jgi:hypothetical protein
MLMAELKLITERSVKYRILDMNRISGIVYFYFAYLFE